MHIYIYIYIHIYIFILLYFAFLLLLCLSTHSCCAIFFCESANCTVCVCVCVMRVYLLMLLLHNFTILCILPLVKVCNVSWLLYCTIIPLRISFIQMYRLQEIFKHVKSTTNTALSLSLYAIKQENWNCTNTHAKLLPIGRQICNWIISYIHFVCIVVIIACISIAFAVAVVVAMLVIAFIYCYLLAFTADARQHETFWRKIK